MAVIPTPASPGLTGEGAIYRAAAMAQLDILRNQMKLGGLKIGQRRVVIAKGVEVLCDINYNKEEVYVRYVRVDTDEETEFLPLFAGVIAGGGDMGLFYNKKEKTWHFLVGETRYGTVDWQRQGVIISTGTTSTRYTKYNSRKEASCYIFRNGDITASMPIYYSEIIVEE